MFGKICREYKNMTPEARTAMLKEDSLLILPALTALGGDGISDFIFFVFTACGADGKLDMKEYELFCDVTGIEIAYSDACALIDTAKTRVAQNAVDRAVDAFGLMSDEVKAAMVSFCLCFCAANGKIERREKKFLKSLIK